MGVTDRTDAEGTMAGAPDPASTDPAGWDQRREDALRDTRMGSPTTADAKGPSKADAMRDLFLHLGAQVYPDGPKQDYADLVDAAFPPDRSPADQADADRREANKAVKAAQDAMAKAQADLNAAAQTQVEAEAKATAEKDKEAARVQ